MTSGRENTDRTGVLLNKITAREINIKCLQEKLTIISDNIYKYPLTWNILCGKVNYTTICCRLCSRFHHEMPLLRTRR